MPTLEVDKNNPSKMVSKEKLKLCNKIFRKIPQRRTIISSSFFFIFFLSSFEHNNFVAKQQKTTAGLIKCSIKTLVSIFALQIIQIFDEAVEPNFVVTHTPVEFSEHNKNFMETLTID